MPATIIGQRSRPRFKRKNHIRRLLNYFETWRHYTNNGITLPVQNNSLIQHTVRRGKPPYPKTMTDKRYRGSARLIFYGRESPTQFRSHPEQVKKIGRDILRGYPFGFGEPGHGYDRVPHGSHSFKRMALVPPVSIIEIGQGQLGKLRPMFRKCNQVLRITIRERTEQDRIDNAEHRAICANS